MALSIFKLVGSVFVDTDKAEQSIAETEKKSSKLSESLTQGISTAGKWAAGLATAAGTAAIALGSTAVKSADDAKKAINGFASATNTTGKDIDAYYDSMLNIYNANFGESFDDVAQSMAAVKQQAGDLGADEIEKMTTNALMMRDTFGFEVNESVRAAQMMMQQFGISSDEAFNLIAQGAQGGLDKNGDMLDSINEYSVHFQQLGLDADDMFNMLANGSAAGTFSVDKLGDAMKEFGIRTKDGSDGSRAAFEALGYDADQMFEIFNKGGDDAAGMTQELIDKLAAMPDGVEKTTAGVALFGTMWEDLGAEGIAALGNLNGGISSTKDALTDINNVKYDNLGAMIEALKRNLETLLIPLGNALMPIIMQIITMLQTNMPLIQGIFETLTPVITNLFETLLPPLMELISGLLPPIADLINSLLPPIIDLLSAIVPVITEIIQSVLPILIELINILLPPIIEIVNMILPVLLTLIQAILPILQPILKVLTPLLNALLYLLEPLIQLISYILPPLIQKFVELYNDWINYILPIILQLAQVFKEKLAAALTALAPVIEAVKTAFSNAWNGIKTVWNGAASFFTGVWSGIKTAFSAVTTWFKTTFSNAWAAVKNVFQAGGKIFEGIKEGIASVFNKVVNGIISGINTVIAVPFRQINSMLNKIRNVKIPVINEKPFSSLWGEDPLPVPQIPALAEGGEAIAAGRAIVGEDGAELIEMPKGARVTPLNDNNNAFVEVNNNLNRIAALLEALLAKEGNVTIDGDQLIGYVNKGIGALI